MRVCFAVFLAALLASGTACAADSPEPPLQTGLDLVVDGVPWLRTVTLAHDPDNREHTYKVFTHIFDFAGAAPITKGPGGLYTHHRGLFIGWKSTELAGRKLDTWSMPDSYQQHIAWEAFGARGDTVFQRQRIGWYGLEGTPFIEEVREIRAAPGPDGIRLIDFHSTLASLAGDIALGGDSHHAGMQVRLANEVGERQEDTEYILPEGAEERENDEVFGAWWTGASAEVGGRRYWLVHMTPPDHPTGQPVYSIRRYVRFGAFFETTLEEGRPLALRFRVVVSDKPLDRAACQALYDAYAEQAP